MDSALTRAQQQQVRANRLRRVHGWLAVAWGVMIPVSVFTGLRSSVPYLVALSVYALMVGHFASWQSSRAETKDDSDTPGVR